MYPFGTEVLLTSTAKMIGAMPAVAVRHERRRNDKRGGGGGRRPSQLPLQLGQPSHGDPTPSPDHRRSFEVYFCGRVSIDSLLTHLCHLLYCCGRILVFH